jgi:hypothetical protein
MLLPNCCQIRMDRIEFVHQGSDDELIEFLRACFPQSSNGRFGVIMFERVS